MFKMENNPMLAKIHEQIKRLNNQIEEINNEIEEESEEETLKYLYR